MKKIILSLRNNFMTGIAVTLPLFITFLLIWFLYTKLNMYILNPVIELLKPYLPLYWMKYFTKALALIVVLLLVCLLGVTARNIIIIRLFGAVENILAKVPIIGRIYKAIRQISSAVLGEGKTIFRKVIMVEYPRKGIYSIGFVTREGKGEIQYKTKKKILSVFVPTTPNPTSGVFLLVPEDEAVILDMTVGDALKMVISGGNVVPTYKEKKPEIT